MLLVELRHIGVGVHARIAESRGLRDIGIMLLRQLLNRPVVDPHPFGQQLDVCE